MKTKINTCKLPHHIFQHLLFQQKNCHDKISRQSRSTVYNCHYLLSIAIQNWISVAEIDYDKQKIKGQNSPCAHADDSHGGSYAVDAANTDSSEAIETPTRAHV